MLHFVFFVAALIVGHSSSFLVKTKTSTTTLLICRPSSSAVIIKICGPPDQYSHYHSYKHRNRCGRLPAGDGNDFAFDSLLTRSEAILRAFSFPLGFAVAFRTGAAVAVIGQPIIPTTLHLLSDDDDDDDDNNPKTIPSAVAVGSGVIRLPTSGARVRVFYPAASITTQPQPQQVTNNSKTGFIETENYTIAPYCTDGRKTSDGMAGLVGFRQLGLSFLLAHLANASSGCYENIPPLPSAASGSTTTTGMPLLVYSHGYGGNMDMATYFLRAIASTGAIVAAVEHTDGTASSTQLTDDNDGIATTTTLPFSPNLLSGREQLDRRANELLEAASQLKSILPSDFEIDRSRVFLGGHSYGGPSALLAASRRCGLDIAGIILHDPALSMGYDDMLPPPEENNDDTDTTNTSASSSSPRKTSHIPVISYTSDEYNRAGVKYGDCTLHVRGAFHGNFVDAPLWAPSWVMRTLSFLIPVAGPADPVQVHEELAKSAAVFMKDSKQEQVYTANIMKGGLFEYIS